MEQKQSIKKSDLISLIEAMIAKYEEANTTGILQVGHMYCPLCIKYTGKNSLYYPKCILCIIPISAEVGWNCVNMNTFPALHESVMKDKKAWQLRLKFWRTALAEFKQIWHPGFYLDINNIRVKLAKIDRELFIENNRI